MTGHPPVPAPHDDMVTITLELAPGVASALYQLAEYRDMLTGRSRLAGEVLGSAVDLLDGMSLPVALGGPDPERPTLGIGRDCLISPHAHGVWPCAERR